MNKRAIVIVAILSLAATGCATYRPMPITSESVRETLSSPDMNALRVEADELRHPLLPPLPFDERDGLSPDEAAILAVVANPALRAARDERGIASAQVLQAGLLPDPRISSDFSVPTGDGSAGLVNSFGLGLDEELSALLSRCAELDAADAHAASVDLDVAWREWRVAEDARLHAYRLDFARKRLALAKRAETSFREFRDDLKTGLDLGLKTRLDLSRAETRFRDLRSKALDARSTMEKERLALNRTLGLPPESALTLEKNIDPRLDSHPVLERLYEDAESRRLDLLALKMGYQSEEARVRGAILSQFPRIDLGLGRDRDTDGVETVRFGLNIDLPIFDRGQGRIARARASRKRLYDEYAARLFEARADIAQLAPEIEIAEQRMSSLDEALSVQDSLVRSLHGGVEEGRIDAFTYLEALDSFYDSGIRRIDLNQRLIELGIALEIASGDYGLVGGAEKPAPESERSAAAERSR